MEQNTAETRREMETVSAEILESMMRPIRVIYIDSDFLYDYRLGALLLLLRGQKDYEYVLSKLPEYECNPTMHITRVFKDLGLTEEDVDLAQNDLGWQKNLHAVSPKTELLDHLTSFIASVNTYNATQSNGGVKLVIIVNCREKLMPNFVWNPLVNYVRSFDPNVKLIRTAYESWDEVSNEVFDAIDMMFVYNMIDFSNSALFSRKIRSLSVMNKIMLAYPQIEKDVDSDQEAKEALDNFSSVINSMFLHFGYIKKSISMKR